jgi:dihydroorotate dehydrogenase electron transfer subunit
MSLRLEPLPSPAERPDPVLELASVVRNDEIAPGAWRITLEAPSIARAAQPGQFAMLTVARRDETAPVLPRPMALYAWDVGEGTVDVVYRVVGDGTRVLTTWRPAETMTTVGPLGRPFQLEPGTRSILLIGRGIGICSLTGLATAARDAGVEVDAVVSARVREALIGSEDFARLEVASLTEVTDADGTSAVDRLGGRLASLASGSARWDQVFVCGSERLMRLATEVARASGASVQVSIEARMACGLGFCHGCATGIVGASEESPLVCVDGPVFVCRWDA